MERTQRNALVVAIIWFGLGVFLGLLIAGLIYQRTI